MWVARRLRSMKVRVMAVTMIATVRGDEALGSRKG